MKLRSIVALLAAAILALAVTACGNDDDKSADSGGAASTAASPAASSEPTIEIVSPTADEAVAGELTAQVKLTNFELDKDAVGMAAKDGSGHLHFAMDDGEYDQPKFSGANGDLAKQLGTDGKYSPSVTPEVTYKDLPAGEHTLEVYVANNDHSNQGAKDSATFTVQ